MGLGWHNRIVQGLPRRSMESLAGYLGTDTEHLAELVGAKEGEDPLNPASSERLHRIAVSIHRLYAVLKDMDETVHWLRHSRKELQGDIPVVLLASAHGALRVFKAISQVPPPRKPEQAAGPRHNTVADSQDTDAEIGEF